MTTPTRLQQELAYRHMARPGWPPLDEALTIKHYAVAINGLARNLNRPLWRPSCALYSLPTATPPVPPTPTAPPPTRLAGLKSSSPAARMPNAVLGRLPEALTFPLAGYPVNRGPGWLKPATVVAQVAASAE